MEKVEGSPVHMPGDARRQIFNEIKKYIVREWAWYGVPGGNFPTTEPTIGQLRARIEQAVRTGERYGIPRSGELQPLIAKAVSVGVAFAPEKVMSREKYLMARIACHLTGLGPLTFRNPSRPVHARFPYAINLAEEMSREINRSLPTPTSDWGNGRTVAFKQRGRRSRLQPVLPAQHTHLSWTSASATGDPPLDERLLRNRRIVDVRRRTRA
jgi:hypothetical protein